MSGQGLECLGSEVDGRLCDLRLCSENLGEEETLELESGRREGPFAPQAARRATEETVGDRRNFLGLDKQTRPFFGRAHGALTSLVSCVSQRKPVLARSPQQGWRIFFSKAPGRKHFIGNTVATGSVAIAHLCCSSVDAAGAGEHTDRVAVPRSHGA